jgi:hypothetical protein
MDFELSDDQLALRSGARELLDDLASPARVRAHTATGDAYDATLWRATFIGGPTAPTHSFEEEPEQRAVEELMERYGATSVSILPPARETDWTLS